MYYMDTRSSLPTKHVMSNFCVPCQVPSAQIATLTRFHWTGEGFTDLGAPGSRDQRQQVEVVGMFGLDVHLEIALVSEWKEKRKSAGRRRENVYL